MHKILNYINGEYMPPQASEWVDNYNPSEGVVYGQIANSDKADIEKAYQAAKNAFPAWSNTTIEERSRVLLTIADLIEENLDQFAEAEATYNVKTTCIFD